MKVPYTIFTQGESTISYTHLSIIERSKLEILHRQGQSSRAIAKELGRRVGLLVPSFGHNKLARQFIFKASSGRIFAKTRP
nr:helix-turn-helix domain-containing protein [Paenibacillus taichungensis]